MDSTMRVDMNQRFMVFGLEMAMRVVDKVFAEETADLGNQDDNARNHAATACLTLMKVQDAIRAKMEEVRSG